MMKNFGENTMTEARGENTMISSRGENTMRQDHGEQRELKPETALQMQIAKSGFLS